MSIGNFKETSEGKETENVEKPKNQILETPEKYKDDFDRKLEANEAKEDQSPIKEKGEGRDGERQSFFTKMKNLFSNKEKGGEKGEPTEKTTEKEGAKMQDTPKKSWELSAEDVQKAREGQQEAAQKAQNGEFDKKKETSETEDGDMQDDARTPWGDAERRREHER